MKKDENEIVVTDEILSQVVNHIEAAATLLGMKFKLLFDATNPEETVGFVIAREEVLNGEMAVKEENGTWSPPARPKHLN